MTLNAISLKFGLVAVIVLLVVLAGYGFVAAKKQLASAVDDTNAVQAETDQKQQNLFRLKQLQKDLDDKSEAVKRAAEIVADSQHYSYQNQIVSDINTYAHRTGVDVIGFDFGSPTTTTTTKTNLPSIPHTKVITANLTLAAPVKYTHFLNFLQAIEKNLTKMQITGIDITPDQKNSSYVSNPGIALQIYVKD